MKRKRMLWRVFFLFLFVGCSKGPQPTVWEGDVPVYYLDAAETKIVREGYTPASGEGGPMVQELLVHMQAPSDEEHIAAIPETVQLPEISMGTSGLVTLQFDETYYTVTGVREVLMRAAVVKTVCQVPEVDSVEFYVKGQPLMGAQNTPVGIMKEEDFIDNTGPDTNYYQYLYATVYYANGAGDALIASNLKIPYSGSETEEQIVLRQLIAGPVEEGLYPVLSGETKVLGVSTKDGICYVDLSAEFLDKLPEVSEEVTIYSVVNSLAELPGVYQVQFLIDGAQRRLYQTMDLTVQYERNLNVIEKE